MKKNHRHCVTEDNCQVSRSFIGSPMSIKSITDYLISAGRKVSQNTVSDYVEALTESFIFYPVERIDIVEKQLLNRLKFSSKLSDIIRSFQYFRNWERI